MLSYATLRQAPLAVFVCTIENNDYTLTFCFSFPSRVCAENYAMGKEIGQSENYKPIISRFFVWLVVLANEAYREMNCSLSSCGCREAGDEKRNSFQGVETRHCMSSELLALMLY